MTAGERAGDAFTAAYGRAPTAVWSAPGRVNLIGEHTDYNDGFVFPFALPQRTAVAIAPRGDGRLSFATMRSNGKLHYAEPIGVNVLAPGAVSGWASYPAGVAWSLHEAGFEFGGADLVIVGEVPTGAGLSSSAALECSVALALLDLAGYALDGPDAPAISDIARWTQRAENDFAGAPTGVLDQTAALACTAAHALFFDVRSGETEQIPFGASAAGVEVLVVDTRASHTHSESGYGERRRGCEQAANLLGVKALRDITMAGLTDSLERIPADLRPLVRHVVTENERVLATVSVLRQQGLRAGLTEIAELMIASHASLRDDYRISCEELDLAVDSALRAGALGARMTGGGFGGSAIALVRTTDRPAIERAVLSAFDERDLTTPRLFTASPAAGAGRDR